MPTIEHGAAIGTLLDIPKHKVSLLMLALIMNWHLKALALGLRLNIAQISNPLPRKLNLNMIHCQYPYYLKLKPNPKSLIKTHI